MVMVIVSLYLVASLPCPSCGFHGCRDRRLPIRDSARLAIDSLCVLIVLISQEDQAVKSKNKIDQF
jgi:hypothetical protein